ncbi:unnamed protein product [Rangifer tarandus platyrhynchus]|uniref:Uncharacterized protein n=1 Tax=Rangifer tarandus platyrhynchus TaxID=3082113 RepID=A0ABN8Z0E4_RANTA|nr:unnamed protein product [Rangifer tarandus platyrhynchus]
MCNQDPSLTSPLHHINLLGLRALPSAAPVRGWPPTGPQSGATRFWDPAELAGAPARGKAVSSSSAGARSPFPGARLSTGFVPGRLEVTARESMAGAWSRVRVQERREAEPGDGSEHEDRRERAGHRQARPVVTKEADTAESGKYAVGAIAARNGQQGQRGEWVSLDVPADPQREGGPSRTSNPQEWAPGYKSRHAGGLRLLRCPGAAKHHAASTARLTEPTRDPRNRPAVEHVRRLLGCGLAPTVGLGRGCQPSKAGQQSLFQLLPWKFKCWDWRSTGAGPEPGLRRLGLLGSGTPGRTHRGQIGGSRSKNHEVLPGSYCGAESSVHPAGRGAQLHDRSPWSWPDAAVKTRSKVRGIKRRLSWYCSPRLGEQSIVGAGGLSAYGMGDPVPAGALESGQRVLSHCRQG